MGSFEYNSINVDHVEDVELMSPESSSYQQFKREIYDTGGIPEERQRLLASNNINKFEHIATEIINSDCQKLIDGLFIFNIELPEYVQNADEVREAVLNDGKYTDVRPEYGDLTPEKRGDCIHSQNDKYRSDDDALCCWHCSDDDTNRPEMFMRADPACDQCRINAPRAWKLPRMLAEHLDFHPGHRLTPIFNDSEIEVSEIHKKLRKARESRSQAIQLAFRCAFSDEEYYYQRAEALLRDIDAEIAKDSGPGAGGRSFEYDAVAQLDEQFELRDETVFKIVFDDDAPRVAWGDFVSDPSEPTFKEADAIIEGDAAPIVVDFFTQRNTFEKRKQVSNYAELYEVATGTPAKAWGITDSTRAELIELDTLVSSEGDHSGGQAGLRDFI